MEKGKMNTKFDSIISIGNSMISSAIWKKKHARVSFSKTSNKGRVLFVYSCI